MKNKAKKAVGCIKLGKMKKETVCHFKDSLIDKKVFDALIKYAKENILNDTDTMVSWALTDILRKQIEEKKQKKSFNETLNKLFKSVKRGKNWTGLRDI